MPGYFSLSLFIFKSSKLTEKLKEEHSEPHVPLTQTYQFLTFAMFAFFLSLYKLKHAPIPSPPLSLSLVISN